MLPEHATAFAIPAYGIPPDMLKCCGHAPATDFPIAPGTRRGFGGLIASRGRRGGLWHTKHAGRSRPNAATQCSTIGIGQVFARSVTSSFLCRESRS